MSTKMSTRPPVRRVTFKAFVEVLDQRKELEFTLTIPPACEGACEKLAEKHDIGIAQFVLRSSLKSGIERVSVVLENE